MPTRNETAPLAITMAALALALAAPAGAQLRPLDPVDYQVFSSQLRAEVGGGVYADQRAALAGTRGTLWEVGNFRVSIRSGRVIVDLGGTVQRMFHEDSVYAPPFGDADPPAANNRRHDAGDYRVGTIVRLTGADAATLATLRFGTRLPTTDNRVGLDRDATDFFATLGVHRALPRVALSAEAGLSINGTRKTTYEQSDVLVYGLTAELTLPGIVPYVIAVGQDDLHNWIAVRGNEDLGELRAGVRIGRRHWLNVAWVHGYRQFSPSNGLQLSGGIARP